MIETVSVIGAVNLPKLSLMGMSKSSSHFIPKIFIGRQTWRITEYFGRFISFILNLYLYVYKGTIVNGGIQYPIISK